MKTLPRILGLIPFFVVVLLVTLLMIYKPPMYKSIVFAFAFSYLIFVPLMYFAVRRTLKRRKAATLAENINAAPIGKP